MEGKAAPKYADTYMRWVPIVQFGGKSTYGGWWVWYGVRGNNFSSFLVRLDGTDGCCVVEFFDAVYKECGKWEVLSEQTSYWGLQLFLLNIHLKKTSQIVHTLFINLSPKPVLRTKALAHPDVRISRWQHCCQPLLLLLESRSTVDQPSCFRINI